MDKSEVLLHVYEITNGLARVLSPMFLGGKQIDGIWHTGIVVYNEEFFFGSMGIQSCKKGEFMISNPDSVISLGKTEIPYEVLMDHLRELASTTFRGSCYHLLDHNCNTFSNELANFLTGKRIPPEITNLPNEVKDTPIGAMIKQFCDSMQSGPSPFSLFPDLEAGGNTRGVINSVAGTQDLPPKTNSKPVSSSVSSSSKKSSSIAGAGIDSHGVGKSLQKESAASDMMPPTIVYEDKAVLRKFEGRRDMLRGLLRPNEFQSFEAVFEYLSLPAADWSLFGIHISLLSRLMVDASMTDELRSISGCLLVLALSRPDVRTVCIHDSTQSLLNLIKSYDTLPPELLKLTAKCLCNFVAERQSAEWLFGSSNETVNICKESAFALCTHCLLNEDKDLTEIGCAISSAILQSGMVSGDVALRFAVAIIEVISSKTYSGQSEEMLWFSLCKCVKLNDQIAELAKTTGLNLKTEEEKHPSIVKYTKSIRHLFT